MSLKTWRRDRRDSGYWKRARDRSASMREGEIVNEVDTAIMLMGQYLTKYRGGGFTFDRENQLDCLREVRLQLEACLGMLENIIPD